MVKSLEAAAALLSAEHGAHQDAKEVDCYVCRVKGGRTRDVLAPVCWVVCLTVVITMILLVLRQGAEKRLD